MTPRERGFSLPLWGGILALVVAALLFVTLVPVMRCDCIFSGQQSEQVIGMNDVNPYCSRCRTRGRISLLEHWRGRPDIFERRIPIKP